VTAVCNHVRASLGISTGQPTEQIARYARHLDGAIFQASQSHAETMIEFRWQQPLGGRFQLLRPIGDLSGGGAGGQTLLARDRGTGRLVVVKASTTPETVLAVQIESTVLGILNRCYREQGYPPRHHPVPELIAPATGVDPNVPDLPPLYFAQEYVESPFRPLPDVMHRPDRPGERPVALRVLAALARLLVVAHGEGIVHGDLNERKPEHVFWDALAERVKVIDWGSADCREIGSPRRHHELADVWGVVALFERVLRASANPPAPLPKWAQSVVENGSATGDLSRGLQSAAELVALVEDLTP
jgi:serine/threonine protein kinase